MPLPEPIIDGDTFFKGVNARLNPGQLEAGFVASAINKRFVNGVVETRPGIKKMPWSNCLTQAYDDNANTGSGYGVGTYVMYSGRKVDTSNGVVLSNVTVTNNTTSDGTVGLSTNGGPASNTKGPYFKVVNSPVAAGLNPVDSDTNELNTNWEDAGHRIFGYSATRTVYGTGIFRDPSGTEYLIVATSHGVFATREGLQSIELNFPATEPLISEDVFFVQCFNVVIMMRGVNQEPLVMKAIATGFETITQEKTDTKIDENDSDGTEQIPNADSAIFFGNRLLVPHSRDLVAASDFLNYTRYQPVMANFRINQGSEDELVALQKVDNTTIAAFKSNSIYVVGNLYGDGTDAILDEVTRDYGAVSAKSTIAVGSDVWFLSSKKGICSLTVASHGKVSAVQLPVSEHIQPIIDRINWNHASKVTAATYANRVYYAVPLDGATENNAILVYDLLQQAWSGYDQGSGIKVKDFVEMEYQGKRRLFFLSTDGFLNLYDDNLAVCGFVDELAGSDGVVTLEQISDEVVTRGYTANDISQKKWRGAEIQVSTNDPKFTVTTVYDGPEEDGGTLVSDKTFSRVSYDKPFDKVDFVGSMANDDFFTKFRGDYSVDLTTEAALPEGTCSLSVYKSQSACTSAGGTWTAFPAGHLASTHVNTEVGFDPDLQQSSANKYKFRGSGRYIQLKITNTQGRLELNTVKVGALAGENLVRKEL